MTRLPASAEELRDYHVVVLEEGGSDAPRVIRPLTRSFHPRLTAEGVDDPLTRLVEDKAENVELWEDANGLDSDSMPGLYWYFP
ncbi:MAG: hypothetical protein HY722_07165, partial [Planctomycetes bacterium]|nr:hypothetical protein [Planctomycetota bacterium]